MSEGRSPAPLGAAGAARGSLASRPDVSPELLAAAQEYVRERSAGQPPSRELDAAWASFYVWGAPLVRRFALACHVPSNERDDCVQDVWAELIMKLPSFHLDASRGQFRQWLFTLVHSEAVDLARRRATRQTRVLADDVPAAHTPDPERQAERDEAAAVSAGELSRGERLSDADRERAVHELLARLDRHGRELERRVLELRWFGGRSIEQIGRELELSPEQVWALHYRAKRRLRRWLSDA